VAKSREAPPAAAPAGSAWPWWPALVAAGVLGALYTSTLLPGVGYHPDTARFQYVGKVLGTPHPTGYPTYVLLNHLFVTLLPLGSLAFRANLLSAVFAAAAAAVLVRLLQHLGVRSEAALAAALLLGVTAPVWSQSVVAEVYTLNLLFVVAVLFFAVRWDAGGSRRDFLAGAAVLALSFGNHMTMVTLLPALLAFVLLRDRRILGRPAVLGWLALFAAAGALQYGYVVWRSLDPTTPYLESRATDFSSLVAVVTGARMHRSMFAFSLPQLLTDRLPMFGSLLWHAFGPLLAVAAYGAWWLGRRPLAALLALAFLGEATFALGYDIADIFPYFIPCLLVVAVVLGLGFEGLAARVGRRWRLVVAAALLALPVATATARFADLDRSHDTGIARRFELVLDTVERDALLLPAQGHQSRFLQYYLLGEGLEAACNVHVTWPLESAARYLDGGAANLYYQHRFAPRGLAVYCLSPEERDTLVARGFHALAIRRGGEELFLIYRRPHQAAAVAARLRERFGSGVVTEGAGGAGGKGPKAAAAKGRPIRPPPATP
jgi:Protein O-mannosyl-transferase TMEM260-like